jgi:hypothetical protein
MAQVIQNPNVGVDEVAAPLPEEKPSHVISALVGECTTIYTAIPLSAIVHHQQVLSVCSNKHLQLFIGADVFSLFLYGLRLVMRMWQARRRF